MLFFSWILLKKLPDDCDQHHADHAGEQAAEEEQDQARNQDRSLHGKDSDSPIMPAMGGFVE